MTQQTKGPSRLKTPAAKDRAYAGSIGYQLQMPRAITGRAVLLIRAYCGVHQGPSHMWIPGVTAALAAIGVVPEPAERDYYNDGYATIRALTLDWADTRPDFVSEAEAYCALTLWWLGLDRSSGADLHDAAAALAKQGRRVGFNEETQERRARWLTCNFAWGISDTESPTT